MDDSAPAGARALARRLVLRLKSPLTAILLAASVVMAATGDVPGCLVIVAIVGLSVAIDLVQEQRADRAARALIARVQVHATVLRDGKPVQVPVRRVRPGDLVVLRAGSIVPADGTLVEANGLHVNEALLTGEAFPVEKQPGEGDGGRLFMGSSVVSGSALQRAERTGRDTEMGRLAGTLAAARPPTAFEVALHGFGLLIMRLTAFMVLFVVLVNAALHRPLLESFLFAVALAVGLTPELLPMIVTVTLSRGALRLAKDHVIVKRLGAIEGLGGMDVLCTDKTGTLTRARLRVDRCIDVEGRESAAVLEAAAANSAVQAGIASPLDAALLERAPMGPRAPRRIAELPFDFERRRVAVLVEEDGARRVLVKGAPEALVERCERLRLASGEARGWTEADREAARRRMAELGDAGLHVIAVAAKDVAAGEARVDEDGLDFLGFVAFEDPPKPEAAPALAALAASGIRVKILTGDEPRVTRHVCEALGLPAGAVLTGEEVARLDAPALGARVDGVDVFCRLTPMQKERIVRTLRGRGHVVGYLGDGINDAPAMHAADVGLSVQNAVDVAREAADLILLRRELSVLHRGVLEGRRTFANIRKYLLMGTSSNFGNMASMAIASLLLPFLPMLPAQVLVNNLLYDVSEIPIPLDRADDEDVAAPQRWDLGLIRDFMWTMGPVSSLFDLVTFWVLLRVFAGDEALFRTGWFVESLATQVLVIFVIRTRGRPWASLPSAALAVTSLAVVALAVALPWTPAGPLLGFEPLPPAFLALVAGLTASYLLVAEAMKRSFYRSRTVTRAPSPSASGG